MKLFHLMSMFIVFCVLFMASCEEDLSNDNSDYLFSDVGIVRFINDPMDNSTIKVIRLQSGDELHIKSDTVVYVLRESGSGYSVSGIGEIDAGDIIEYFYHMEDRNFQNDPNIIYPTKIYIN